MPPCPHGISGHCNMCESMAEWSANAKPLENFNQPPIIVETPAHLLNFQFKPLPEPPAAIFFETPTERFQVRADDLHVHRFPEAHDNCALGAKFTQITEFDDGSKKKTRMGSYELNLVPPVGLDFFKK